MINLNKLKIGMTLISHEPDPLWAEELKKNDKVLIGTVYSINYEAREVILRVNRESRIFKPENLWYLPYEVRISIDNPWTLKGFILSIAEDKVSSSTIREIAKGFKQQGVKPVAPQELLEAMI